MTEEFSTIQIDISEETELAIIRIFMDRCGFDPASIHTFNTVLEESDGNVPLALYQATLNYQIIVALQQQIEQDELDRAFEEDQNNAITK